MARDPDRRAASREADKLRKRARRAAERLEKLAAQASGFQAIAYRQQAAEQREIARSIKSTRRGGVQQYETRATRAMEQAKAAPPRSAREIVAQGFDFTDEMRKAHRGEASVLGRQGRERVQLFYRITQAWWQGEDPHRRNEIIMERTHTQTLEDAYKEIARQPEFRRAMRDMDTSGGRVRDTDDMDTAYREAERTSDQDGGSPPRLMRVSYRQFAKAYARRIA